MLLSLVVGCILTLVPHAVQGGEDAEMAQLEQRIAQARTKKDTEPLAAALYQMAQRKFDNGDTASAIPLIRESIELDTAAKRPCGISRYALALALFSQAKKSGKNDSPDYDAAISEFESARSAFEREGPDQIPLILNSMGMVELSRRRLPAATKYLVSAGDAAMKLGQNKTAADAYSNLASMARSKADLVGAIKYQQQAVDILSKSDEDEAKADAFCRLGDLEKVANHYEESIRAYNSALEAQKKIPESKRRTDLLGSAYFGIGECYWTQHKLEEAAQQYQKAIDVLKDNAAGEIAIRSSIALGITQADLNKLDLAQATHQNAVEMAKQAKKPDLQLNAAIQLAFDSMMRGRTEQALGELLSQKEVVALAPVDAVQRGTYSMMIGRCYRALGQTPAALKYYADALHQYESAKDPVRQADALSNIAVAYLDSNQTLEFERYAANANELFTLLHDERGTGTLDYNKAQFELTRGNNDAAIKLYDSALAKFQEVHDDLRVAGALRGKGFALLYKGQPKEAAAVFEQALVGAKQSDNLEAEWDCNLGLGTAYRKLGDNQKAIGYLKTAVDLVERERQQLTRDSFKTHNLDFRRACYLELSDAYIADHKAYEALEVAEKGKARAFLDLLSNRQSRTMDLAFVDSGPGMPGGGDGNKPTLVASAATAGTRSVDVAPRAHSLIEPTMLSPISAKAPDIAEIKDLVTKRQSTCVEYYLFPTKLVIWVIKPDLTINTVTVPIKRGALAQEVNESYRALLAQPKDQSQLQAVSEERQKRLRGLYTTLIAPIEQYLPKTADAPVTILPDGELFMVPFAALIMPDGSFVTEKHTLSYAPAIGVFRSTQQLAEEHKDHRSLLAFGNPSSPLAASIGLPPLPYAEKEVKNLAVLFGVDHTNLKIGSEATKAAFAQLAPNNSCLHLATHGLVDEEQPTRSALVLAPDKGDDGMLTVGDILSLKNIKANLIVLSACQTGRGKITGDGVVGLSRAFIIAGTPSVIVSQWNVDDVMTEYLMRNFYQEYLAGKPKAQALRDAQLAAIKVLERNRAQPLTPTTLRANPRFWAAFQIVGEQK